MNNMTSKDIKDLKTLLEYIVIKCIMRVLNKYFPKFEYIQIPKENIGEENEMFFMRIQGYYRESNHRLYLEYEFDNNDEIKKIENDLYDEINALLQERNKLEYIDPKIYIVGGAKGNKGIEHHRDIYCSNILSPYSIACYEFINGRYRFLVDKNEIGDDRLLTYKKIYPSVTDAEIKEFDKAVLNINKSYNFNIKNGEECLEAFSDFKELYKSTFGVDLETVDETNKIELYFVRTEE